MSLVSWSWSQSRFSYIFPFPTSLCFVRTRPSDARDLGMDGSASGNRGGAESGDAARAEQWGEETGRLGTFPLGECGVGEPQPWCGFTLYFLLFFGPGRGRAWMLLQ
jgi:hypothetical protein